MAKQLNVSLSFNADTSKAKAQIQDLQNTLNQLVKGSAASSASSGRLGITKELMEAQVAATKLQTILNQSMNSKTGNLDLTKFSESFNRAGMDLKVLKGQLDLLGPTGQKAFMSLASSIVSADVPLKRTNALVSELWTTMKNTVRWQISSSVLHGFMGTIQSAVGYAQDLNESLNNIRIVTGQSTEQMAAFAERANKAAKALSTTTTEYTNASLIYYQQGLSDQEVQDRADITIKMAHASGQSAEIVSDQMTAVWNNFYDGSKSLEHYADVMTALGAATASSSDEIAGGLEKFASVADMIGLSYEYAASALATITATTRQSEDVVGTALKTIFARIQGLSLGETLDDGTNLNKYSEALQKVGISIFEQNGELKDMDNILNEMGAKWETLNKDQQVALAQTVAGVRQYNQLVSLMDNWDFFESNLDIANTSEGALQEQADIYAESWQAARDRVKAAAQDIYDSILDPDFFIILLDGFEKLLSVVANFSDALNGLPGILSLLGVILTKTFSTQLANSIDNMAFSLKSMVGLTKQEIDQFQQLALKEVNKMSFNTGTEAGDAEAMALKRRLQLQNEIRNVAEGLNENQRAQLVSLLEINDAYAEQAIKAAKAKDAASDKVQETASNMRSQIRRASVIDDKTGEELSAGQKISQFTQAQSKLKSDMQAGIKAGQQLKWLITSISESSKNLPIANKYMEQLKEHMNKVGRTNAAKAIDDLTNKLQKGKISVEQYKKQIQEIITVEELMEDTIIQGSNEFSKRLQQYNLTQEQCDKLANEMMELAQAEKTSSDAARQASQANVELKASIMGFKNAMDSFGQSVVKGMQGISQISMGIMSLKGAWDTLNNSDLSFGEKLLQVTMSLSMAIPSLILGVKALKEAELGRALATVKTNAALLINNTLSAINANITLLNAAADTTAGAASATLTGSLLAQAAAWVAVQLSIAPLAALLLVVVGGIVALVAAGAGLVALFNAIKNSSPEAKLKTLQERAEKSAEAFNRVQQSVNATKAAIENLEESYDTIDNLIEGTQEWRDAINDANTQVLNLLDNYPELANYITTDSESGLMQLSDEGIDYLNKENTNRLNAANRLKINDQIAVSEQEIKNSYTDFSHIGGDKGSLNSQWAEIMQSYYNGVGDAMFTDAGAQAFMETMQNGGWGTSLTQENFKEIIENNKKLLQENAIKQKNIDLLNDLNLESQFRDLGSTRSADQIRDLIGETTYEDIKSQKFNDTKQSFGDWNDHINYKESDAEWDMIQDFMNLQGDNVEYVAQRKGKMVLEVDGEEIEYSKDEVYDALSELYTSPELQERLESDLKDTLKSSIGNAVENLDIDQLTNLDNIKSDIIDSLIGDINAEGMSADEFATAKKEATAHGEDLFSGIINAYSQTEGSMEAGLDAFEDNTQYIDANSEAFLRQVEALNAGTISAKEFTDAIGELNAQGQIASMEDYFSAAAEDLGLGAEDAQLMQEYAEHIRSVAKEADDLADSLAEDAESAADLAVEITRMNKGVESLADGFEDWGDILKKSSKSSQEYASAMSKTKKALSDVLDVEEDMVSDDFVTNHLDQIAKAAKGDEEAIDSLRQQMDEEIMLRVSEGKAPEVIAELNSLDQQVHDIAANLPDIEVGAILDDADFLAAANNLVTQAGMTADEANAYFAGIGYEPLYNTTEIENANSMQIPDGRTELSVDHIGWTNVPIDLPDWFPGDHNITLPKITYSAKPVAEPPIDAEADMTLTSFSGGDTPPPIRGMRKKATGAQNNYSSKNSGGGRPGGGGKGGGGGGGGKSNPAKPVKFTKKSDIVERYKEQNDILDDIEEELKDISKQSDRAFGLTRLKQMDKEQASLLKQKKALEDKAKAAKDYLKIDKEALQQAAKKHGLNFDFDDEGNISNYTTELTKLYDQLHAAEVKMNGMSTQEAQDEFKESTITPIEDKIEEIKDLLDQYDETKELLEDLEDEIDDAYYAWQDSNYEELTYRLELKIEVNDADLKKLDYYLNKYSDNFYKMAESAELLNKQIPELKEALSIYEDHKAKLDQAYADGEISQEAYIEGLKEVRDGYYENLEALIDLDKQMLHYYEDTLSEARSELDDFTDHMEHLTEVFDHYLNLLDILGRSKDFEAMNDFLSGKAETLRDRLDVAKEYYEMLLGQKADAEQKLNAAIAAGDDAAAELYKEEWDAIVDEVDAAQEEVLSLTEEWADAMKAVIENNMAEIADTLEKTLTGGTTFDTLMDEFDKLNTRQEEYLTKTNQIYETNKLMRTASKALDETDNKVAKQKLKNFIDETKSLQENTKLSQYELEIQQAKYDLLLAEIALEEAKNAKSTVRLSRDSEGNFGYVYTADQDKVNDAQQAYEDADNRLYNLSLEGQQEFTEKYLQATQEMYNQLTELQQAWLNGEISSEEEYERRKEEILNHYLGPEGVLTTYQNLYNIAVRTDADATADNWQKDYGAMTQNTEDWKDAVNKYLVAVEEQTAQWAEVSEQANEDVEGALNDSATATEELTDESAELRDTIIDEVIPAIEEELDWVKEQTEAYAEQREELLALIEAYEDYIDAIDEQIEKEAGIKYDKNTDYSALMMGYLAAGGHKEDSQYKELERQREAKIDGESLSKDYYGSRVGDDDYNIQANNTWYKDKDAVNKKLKELGIQTFATGGYTGDWGPEGKLAILHEKELILNAGDTANLLSTISFIRDLVSLIDSQATSASLYNLMSTPGVTTSQEVLEQKVEIHAEFPNATDHNEIEEAFNNLVNRASQYANRK